jgi:hypothetical protein
MARRTHLCAIKIVSDCVFLQSWDRMIGILANQIRVFVHISLQGVTRRLDWAGEAALKCDRLFLRREEERADALDGHADGADHEDHGHGEDNERRAVVALHGAEEEDVPKEGRGKAHGQQHGRERVVDDALHQKLHRHDCKRVRPW